MEIIPAPVWARKQRETQQAFAAFELYRDLGEERSYARVAVEINRSIKLMERWGKRWSWVSRAQAWDAEQRNLEAVVFHKRRQRAIQAQADLGEKMREVAYKGLGTLDPTTLAAAEIARLAETGVKLERLAYGDSTENNANNTGITFVVEQLPSWAKSTVDSHKNAEETRSIPASPNARSLPARSLMEGISNG